MKKAFTLVELIVVITILAILGAIAFISLQGYSMEARDTKRISDTRSLLNKINIETTKGAKLSELITINKPTNKLTINGEHPVDGYQGIVNFKNLKENGENFKDPKNKNQDYPIAYTVGGTGTGAYSFMQMATISEKNNTNKLTGNYFKLNETTDSPSLFTHKDKDGTDVEVDYITEEAGNELVYVPQGGSDNGGGVSGTCVSPTPSGAGIKDTTIGNPINQNTPWTKDASICGFTCNDGYTGDNCDIQIPSGVTDLESSTIGCGTNNPDVIATINGTKLRIAGCNATGTSGTGVPYKTYTETGDVSGVPGTVHYYYTWQNAMDWCAGKGTGWRLPSQDEFISMISTFGWTKLTNPGSTPYTATQTPSPYYFYPAGFWSSASLVTQGTSGFYWSSKEYDSNYVYNLLFTTSYINTLGLRNKTYDGLSVRCVKNY